MSHLFVKPPHVPHDYLECSLMYLHQIFFRTLGGASRYAQLLSTFNVGAFPIFRCPPAGHEPHRDLLLHADPSHHDRSPQEQWLVLQVSPSHVPTNHAPQGYMFFNKNAKVVGSNSIEVQEKSDEKYTLMKFLGGCTIAICLFFNKIPSVQWEFHQIVFKVFSIFSYAPPQLTLAK